MSNAHHPVRPSERQCRGPDESLVWLLCRTTAGFSQVQSRSSLIRGGTAITDRVALTGNGW